MKTLLKIVIWFIVIYLFYTFAVKFAIDNWITNAQSANIEIENERKYFLPEETMNAKCVQFIIKWIDNREVFTNAVKDTSKLLWVDYNIVMSAILWEQIRISCKWVRWDLKWVILNTTPKLLRSHNVSVWIVWIKLNTAFKIKKDAIKYWYWDNLRQDIWEENLAYDDISWIYATYLVKNIIYRRQLSWYDISKNAWIVWTLYNLGNRNDKEPNANPKIWWSIITIDWKQFLYWEISLGIYNYLENNKWETSL